MSASRRDLPVLICEKRREIAKRPEHLPTTDFLLPDSEARIKAYYSSAA
jgi:hypothetical protein